jgi:FkbM family methyltransferase
VIDVDTNFGLWTFALSRYFDRVEAFEPQPRCCAYLRWANLSGVNIHALALSSSRGERELNIPSHMGLRIQGMATFCDSADASEEIMMRVGTMDDFGYRGVSFIKIDVEGHESDVLAGARRTIARERPVMVIEIEQRHLDIPYRQVLDSVVGMGYAAFFFNGDRLCPLAEFDYEKNQQVYLRGKASRFNPLLKKYINNFVFKPVVE